MLYNSNNQAANRCGGGPGVPVVSERTETYLRLLGLHRLFSVPGPTPLGEVVHGGEFNEGREDKGVANGDEPVHCSRIRHFGK